MNNTSNNFITYVITSLSLIRTVSIIFILTITSCKSSDVVDIFNAPKASPVFINTKANSGFFIDENNKMMTWSFDKNGNVNTEEFLENVHSFHINADGIMIVDQEGEVWVFYKQLGALVLQKDIYKNELEKLKRNDAFELKEDNIFQNNIDKYQDPIVKAMPFKQGAIFLSVDGKLDREEQFSKKDNIDFSLFPPIKDFYATYNQVLAIDLNGEVWVAGKDRYLGSDNKHTFISEPKKIEGLTKIKRVGKELNKTMDSFYAIDENDNVYYWGYSYYSGKPKLSNYKGVCLSSSKIITADAKQIPFSSLQNDKVNYKPFFETGYGEWTSGKNYEYLYHLQKDGYLIRYTKSKDSRESSGFKLVEPKQVGDAKVKLDFFLKP